MNQNSGNRDTLRNRLKVFQSEFAKNTEKFCQKTTLNGVKYFADKTLYPFERIYFGIAFITVVMLAGYFILKVWNKWSNAPVIFGTNPFPSYITDEPFPAVTFCNLNVAYKSKTEQFSIHSTEYAMLQMLCKRKVNSTIADSITNWSNFSSFMTEIAQPCSKMLKNCRFGAIDYNCSELFKPVITDEGLCCTFNRLHPAFIYNLEKYKSITEESEYMAGFKPVFWSSENGYQSDLPKNYYPRPTPGVGETLGLSVILDVESHEYYCSSLSSIGFKTLLHSPRQSPSLRELGILISPGLETKALVRNEKYVTEQKLRKINLKYRQCLFEDEKNLTIHLHYIRNSCETECLAKLLIKYCGCIAFYMPLIYGNETICSLSQSKCVEQTRISSMLSKNNATVCEEECPPSCFDIYYIVNFFSTPLSHKGFKIVNQAIKNMSSSYVQQNIVAFHVYYNEYAYRSFIKTEFFGGIDALSSIGGLIGLFVGFSFIFFAEIIFFTTIKPFRSIRQAIALSRNLRIVNNSNIKVHPSWKKPIRKRYRHNNGTNKMTTVHSNPFQKYKNRQEHMEDFFKSKWYRRRQLITDVDNSY